MDGGGSHDENEVKRRMKAVGIASGVFDLAYILMKRNFDWSGRGGGRLSMCMI